MIFYLLAFVSVLSMTLGYISMIEAAAPPKAITLFLSVMYTEGDFYTREAANKLCENDICDNPLALVNFMYDDLKRMPRKYSFDRFRPIWYNDVLIATDWNDFIKTKIIPIDEPFWSGVTANCDEWSGSGEGGAGLNSFEWQLTECEATLKLMCMCYKD
jgi:hypothetical protein